MAPSWDGAGERILFLGPLKLATAGPGRYWRGGHGAPSTGAAASKLLLTGSRQEPHPGVSDLDFSRKLRSLNV